MLLLMGIGIAATDKAAVRAFGIGDVYLFATVFTKGKCHLSFLFIVFWMLWNMWINSAKQSFASL